MTPTISRKRSRSVSTRHEQPSKRAYTPTPNPSAPDIRASPGKTEPLGQSRSVAIGQQHAIAITNEPKGFLKLPLELRERVYGYYFTMEGGYHYNYTTRSLTTERGERVNYQLGLVCRRIAIDTRALPFKLNDIHFSTTYCESNSEQAGHFDVLLRSIDAVKNWMVLHSAAIGGQLDQDVADHVSRHFPSYRHIIPTQLGSLRKLPKNCIRVLGEPPSLNRDFASSVLDLVAEQPDFEHFSTGQRCWNEVSNFRAVIGSHVDPWAVPNQDDLEEMQRILPDLCIAASSSSPENYWDQLQYRFSAAAIAIQFLDGLPKAVRLRLHNITLHEKHLSVGQPACHARGLIRFCKENPKLRIKRIVDLWRNILQTSSDPLYTVMPTYRESPDTGLQKLRAEHVSKSIALWVMEALALPRLGMPKDAITLVLDGSLQPNKTTQVFRTVQMDIACQIAFELHCAHPQTWVHHPGAGRWYVTRRNSCYIMNGFPEAMQDIFEDKSIVKRNFEVPPALNSSWNPTSMQNIFQHASLDGWEASHKLNRGRDHDTEEPLKGWLSLRMENFILGRTPT